MSQNTTEMTSVNAEKEFQDAELASSNRFEEEEQSSRVSPEIESSFKEARVTGVENTNESDSGGVLAKALSKTTSRISVDPGPPPDGGLVAWTQVVCGHLIVFNTWGYIVSYGVFQTYYVAALGHPPSDISWVRTSRTNPFGAWRVTRYRSLTIARPAE